MDEKNTLTLKDWLKEKKIFKMSFHSKAVISSQLIIH